MPGTVLRIASGAGHPLRDPDMAMCVPPALVSPLGGRRPPTSRQLSDNVADEVTVGTHRGLSNALSRLQGRWRMTSGSRDGRPLPAALVERSERVTEGEETIVRIDGQLLSCATFTVDTSAEPHTIDCHLTAGPGKGQVQYGIYRLTDDLVRFCFAAPGAPRPGRFDTTRGDGTMSTEWRKVPD